MPEISIIVPVYNVEPYLRRCIDSILAQEFADFELILVDDGSPDHCGRICDEYAQKDKRIVVIHKENGGVSSARNLGLAMARGTYIMFCDGDDYVDRQWCKKMHQVITEHPDAWAFSNAWKVDFDGTSHPVDNEGSTPGMLHCGFSYFQVYQKGLSAFSWNKIYELSKIKRNHLSFNKDQAIGEDVIFNIHYCQKCQTFVYLQDPLYYYCYNDASAMGQYRTNLFEVNAPLFRARLPLIAESEVGSFCDIYFYNFLQWLENAFDPRNKMSFLQKMRYNQRMMQTEEFRFCIAHATGKNDSPLFMRVVRLHNYYIYWLFQSIMKVKAKLLSR